VRRTRGELEAHRSVFVEDRTAVEIDRLHEVSSQREAPGKHRAQVGSAPRAARGCRGGISRPRGAPRARRASCRSTP
jgi:hypothetical protein